MYFFEWGSWEAALEPDAEKNEDARTRRLRKKITPYENEQAEEEAAQH